MVALLFAAVVLASPVLGPPTPGSAERHQTQTECAACHPQAAASVRAADRLVPGASPLLPGPALHFNHQRHAARGIDCTTCHPAGQPATKAACATCHAVDDSLRCTTCHLAAADGRVRTDTAFGRLRPADHTADFTRAHAAAARLDPATCESCHAPPDCQACHAGRLRPVSLHPGDYLTTHGPDARRNQPDCASCHRAQTFCVDCHAQSGLAQTAPPRSFGSESRDRVRFHPEGFVGDLGGLPGPEHHRLAARRNLAECVSCHQESDCVRCHSAQATSRLRATPHPPGYAGGCREDYAVNPRSCVKCHQDTDLTACR